LIDINKNLNEAQKVFAAGDYQLAQVLYKQILQADPSLASAWNGLGLVAYQFGQFQEAAQLIQNAIKLSPKRDQYLQNLGSCYWSLNRFDDAEACYQKVLEIAPSKPQSHFNLGLIAQNKLELDAALCHYQAALTLDPNHLPTLNNLANIYKDKGEIEQAIVYYRRAIKIKPDYAVVYNNLGNVLKNQGHIDEAIDAYHQALQIDPNLSEVRSSLLLTLGYSPNYSAAQVYNQHRLWETFHTKGINKPTNYANEPNSARKLKVGYLSPDFREHSVAYFLDELFQNHGEEFEIYCYANNTLEDSYTQKLKAQVAGWRVIASIPDEAAFKLIQQDKIDILVDLAGHTSRNRLGVFARKPAPISITYLGYLNTTGLSAIDYRLTDELADPQGNEKYYSEELVRLPKGLLCYTPPTDAPELTPLPALQNSFITFGSFNYHLAKITPQMIALWSRLLSQISNAKLLIKSASFADRQTRDIFYQKFAEHQIDRSRLLFQGWVASKNGHMAKYSEVDIALDTFPYNGVTTICEALWMGLPVVSLAGEVHASRMGKSILSRVGLTELATDSEEEYLNAAQNLCQNLQQLSQLRAQMRLKMSKSSLMDGIGITEDLENAYRKMWIKWCENQKI
jgi:protein O-GlcNAc transferase